MDQQQRTDGNTIHACLAQELDGYRFHDVRLARRFRELAAQLWDRLGQTIPMACQDWSNTKAAYRFFANPHVHEGAILDGHFHSTKERFAATEEPVLVLHDTTTFTFQRDDLQPIGMTHKVYGGKDEHGRHKARAMCGILMHSSLTVTPEGLPLGLAAVKFWSRQKFKGCTALKRHTNPTRVPIEAKESIRWLDNIKRATTLLHAPARCIHVGDRESDIYELFCLAHQLGTHFLVRTCVDRLAGDGGHTHPGLAPVLDDNDAACHRNGRGHRRLHRDRTGLARSAG
ncbi:MAG TPA: transposase DNA-binding-containing protein [Paucimonas sp.]|nr:transposase DNA-binding-containing protein [Paucimonas sp.]